MNGFLLALFLGGFSESGTRGMLALPPRESHAAVVAVVADGAEGWSAKRANKAIDELTVALGPSYDLKVARYDAAPVVERQFAVRGANRDTIMVTPRTPLREVMEQSFALSMRSAHPHDMVVIAYEEFYSSAVSTSHLVAIAQRSGMRVHAIEMASDQPDGPKNRTIGRGLKNALAWIVERIWLRQQSHSPRDTASLLRLLAAKTGGTACVAGDAFAALDCADTIALAIRKH